MAAWRHILAAALAAAAALAPAAVRAQAIEAEPSAARGCLTLPAGEPTEPVYPFDQYKGGVPGRVKASVTLPGGLFGNDVEILSKDGDDAFVEATREFLRKLRAPCLKRGESATLVYEFHFTPDQRSVAWSSPRDADEGEREKRARCVQHQGQAQTPTYPESAQRRMQQARVLGVLTFDAADTPPRVELLHRPSAQVFTDAIREWTAGLRMPCHPGGPVTMRQLYLFKMEGAGAYGFRSLTLTELLSVGKGMQQRKLQLDTTTMGCPFELKFIYYQPLRPNAVGEAGVSDPRRRPLLELLAGLELDLRASALDSVYADTADVAVPCIKLNLNPKE